MHTVTPIKTGVVTTNSDPVAFQSGDAALGAGLTAGVLLFGAAGAIAVRRRAHLRHP